jgi:mRNA interferase RelE/StbE
MPIPRTLAGRASTPKSGYNLARMRYEIVLAPEAVEDLDDLKANLRSEVLDALERHLRHEPSKVSRSRIKRLRGRSRPQYRLRVGDEFRIFYDVTADTVEVLAIVAKSETSDWLERHGERNEESGPLGNQG